MYTNYFSNRTGVGGTIRCSADRRSDGHEMRMTSGFLAGPRVAAEIEKAGKVSRFAERCTCGGGAKELFSVETGQNDVIWEAETIILGLLFT